MGSFAVISTVTNPFCDSCNRLRLTADGKLKNCLFSSGEYDLLSSLRNGESFDRAVDIALRDKFAARAVRRSQCV